MDPKFVLSRRRMLGALGVGTAALLAPFVRARPASAGSSEPGPFFVFCYFSGGWDTLLSLDPRNQQKPGAGIQPAYDRVAGSDASVKAVLAAEPTGLVTPAGSNITFGPAVGKLSSLYDELCVVRGIDMGSLTHEVGRRYFLTGKFPRGLAASGSSLPTQVVSTTADATAIPNLVLGVETYNEGLTPAANGLVVRGVADLGTVLQPLDPSLALPSATAARIDELLAGPRCLDDQLDGTGLVTTYQASRAKAALLGSGKLWQDFDFGPNPAASGEIAALYEAFGVDPANPAPDLAAARGRALIAGQAITKGVSQAVSIRLAEGIDTHDDDWETIHAPRLRAGFDALADLITFLKSREYKSGQSYWDNTVLVAFSEFARSPLINGQGGRDHHLSSACLVAGKGIRKNRVVGASNEKYDAQPIDLETGKPSDSGVRIRPADVHATVLEAMGLDHDHLANQSPNLVPAILA